MLVNVRHKKGPAPTSLVDIVARHKRRSTFTERGSRGRFQFFDAEVAGDAEASYYTPVAKSIAVSRCYPIGFHRIDGAEWLPRGSLFTLQVCALEPKSSTLYLMQVGVTGDNSVGEVYLSSDPAFPLVRNGSAPKTEEEVNYAKKKITIRIHDTIGVKFDHLGNISFLHNSIDLGVAFRGLDARYVRPAAMLYLPNSIGFEGEVQYF